MTRIIRMRLPDTADSVLAQLLTTAAHSHPGARSAACRADAHPNILSKTFSWVGFIALPTRGRESSTATFAKFDFLSALCWALMRVGIPLRLG